MSRRPARWVFCCKRTDGRRWNRASDEEVVLARLLEKALRKSEAVDREALCIVAGHKVHCSSSVRSVYACEADSEGDA